MVDYLRGLDAATILTPHAQKVADAGFFAVGRYLKSLTAAEVSAIHAAGLGLWLIYETTADRALGGVEAGRADGGKALAQAQALGAPTGTAIYFTVDTDAGRGADTDRDGSADAEEAAEYFVAAKAAVASAYRAGYYADGDVLTILGDRLEFPWLPGAMGWSGSRAYDATGAWAMKQGPQIGANRRGNWLAMDWPALPFAYDPNLIAPDRDYCWIGGTAGAVPGKPAETAVMWPPSSNLYMGSRGEYVRELQRRIGVPVDGVFGRYTQTALRTYQRKMGLIPDGIVGPATAATLSAPEHG